MIQVSDSAIGQVKKLQQASQENRNSVLRLKVVGGGCSGMSYKLDFDKDGAKENDKKFEKDGVMVVVDPKSFLFLSGTTLDFSDGLNGKGFEFVNPNATQTCGCGSSFRA